MKKALIFLVVCMMFAGCSNAQKYAKLSSNIIGCQPDEIEIERETLIPITGTHDWEAVCNGKRYICKYQSTTGVSCVEMFTPFVPEKAPSASRQ